ncbi:RNA 2',3'-cyclic phosphodiesterase [Streptomyces sp. NPDC058045]|uniref:RNA 2',3'-cyclic phosphodiesterase n=1 Tax=Streptomyces sp. NPDC058045 TaxID=3346311 RepID=UPI0036EFD6C4
MRLFAAVVPPGAVLEELAAEVRLLRALPGGERMRWTEPPGWHLTLAFYGEVPEDDVPELSDRLARAARRTEAFRLALRGGGRFGGDVLWAGAGGDTRTLKLLAGRAEAAGRRTGLDLGPHRPYRPHLSLARNRTPHDLRPHTEALADFTGTEWTVTELALIRSRLPHTGTPGERPHYAEVASWPLHPSG